MFEKSATIFGVPKRVRHLLIQHQGNSLDGLLWHSAEWCGPSKSLQVASMVEEPETHLHPKAQAELASVMAEEAKSQDMQIIMTTHSEHILGRLLTLVAEGELSKDELAIYAFAKDDGGVCSASQIEVTEDGRVKGGLQDFFETELDELDRYMKALQSDK